MSSTSPQRRPALTSLARGRASVELARLRVVPRLQLRSSAPRIPFVTLVSVVLLAGIVGLLLFNTSMQQASFDQTRLEAQQANLTARRQALERDLETLRDPQRLAVLANRQGMVPAPNAAFIDIATGKVIGVPTSATPADRVPVPPLTVLPPPPAGKPIYVREPAPPAKQPKNRADSKADKKADQKADRKTDTKVDRKTDSTRGGEASGDRAATTNNEEPQR